MSNLLEIRGVTKTYGNYTALNNVSLTIPKGSVYGLLGPNGAGKTSLIRIINQITIPDKGEVILDGEKLAPHHISDIGYLPEERGLYKSMKVGEQALYLAQLKGMSKSEAKKRLKYWFDKLHSYTIKYDVIGQSYYPWWHGNLLNLRECLNFTALEYKKDIILVETAYNYDVAEYKEKKPPFPETEKGQKEFLEHVNDIILHIPNNLGKGIFWWEPAAPFKSFTRRTFFSNDGEVKPVIEVFDKYVRY